LLEGSVPHTVASDGVRLATVSAGDPAAPVIVFVHGYPDTKEVWFPVMERLAPEFNVVAYDVRGAGASSAPRGLAAYGFDRLAEDLTAVLDAVAPGRRAHLVGHDWGAIQGWEFATAERFDGRLASFTALAGPALGHVVAATREPLRHGHVLTALNRLRRSWYILPLLTPGGPTLAWRGLLSRDRWRRTLQLAEHIPVDEEFPAPSVVADGLHGANLYRRNIAPRLLRPAALARARVPVQLIVPSRDRFISDSYYDVAERIAPGLRRRTVEGSHWAQRGRPRLVAHWIGGFAREAEAGTVQPGRRWRRGGGLEQLDGRLALVTGAGSGIGRATAGALATHGARVLLVDRDESSLAAVGETIPDSRTLVCDVADPEAMERMALEVLDSEGTPDVVLNNAGIAIAGGFLYTEAEDWRRIVDVNLLGVATGCRLFGRAMVLRGEGGHIVNTASAAAFMPSRSLPVYAATKAAVLMLTESVRAELVPFGVGVTAACPGVVATNITRAARYVGRSEEDQARLADHVTRLYRRRNFTPERVAEEILKAIGEDRAVAVITPEAKLMRAISRLSPGLARRLAAYDALPV
jgi:NAD(P)-dependent dehydrogenase (short-subunit alcohol dehydrogenase family)/pimeloyl-ACP methyl ester carboxylesterase